MAVAQPGAQRRQRVGGEAEPQPAPQRRAGVAAPPRREVAHLGRRSRSSRSSPRPRAGSAPASRASRARRRGCARGSSAGPWRRTQPRMPSMNDSSEPVETSSTRTPLDRLLAQQPRELEQHRDGGEVVVGAGDDGAGGDVAERQQRCRRRCTRPSLRSGAGPQRAQRRRAPGPAATSRIICGEVVCAAYQPGNVSATSRVSSGRKIRPPLRGVVVGDEHERLLRARVAGLPDDVVGRAVRGAGGGRAAGRRRRRRRSPPPPAARAAPARRPPSPASTPAADSSAERDRHRADRRGSSSTRAGTPERLELAADPLRRPPLARPRPTAGRTRRGARRWRAGGRCRPAWAFEAS